MEIYEDNMSIFKSNLGKVDLGSYIERNFNAFDSGNKIPPDVLQGIVEHVKFCVPSIEGIDNFTSQLKSQSYFSSYDHHNISSFSLVNNANLLYQELTKKNNKKFLINFSCANIPLNNASYPKGVYFKKNKTPLLPSKFDMAVTYNFNFKDRLINLDNIPKEVKTSIDESISQADFNYSNLITRVNYNIWNKFFDGFGLKQIYIPLEVLFHLFFKSIEFNKSLTYKILFDKSYKDKVLEAFEGEAGFWDTVSQKGTHFFWYVGDNFKKYRLFFDGNCLRNSNKKISIEYTYENILDGIKKGELVPSVFLCYVMLIYDFGIKLIGGFNQIQVVEKIISQFEQIFAIKTSKEVNKFLCGALTTEGFDLYRMKSPFTRDEINEILKQDLAENIGHLLKNQSSLIQK